MSVIVQLALTESLYTTIKVNKNTHMLLLAQMLFHALFNQTLPEGRTVSDEFLVLLACGRARSELQTFLVDDLTAKVRYSAMIVIVP